MTQAKINSRDPKDLHDAIEKQAIQSVAEMDSYLKSKYNKDLSVRFISTYRSQAMQDELYAQGRTKPGKKVTWVRTSAHNTDLPETPNGDAEAFDIGIFLNVNGKDTYLAGSQLWEVKLYQECGTIGEKYGFEWGGRWEKGTDMPHFQRKNWKELK